MKKYLALVLAILSTACAGALQGGTIGGPPPGTTAGYHRVGLTVRDDKGAVAGAMCGLDGATDQAVGPSDANGTIFFPLVPPTLRATQLVCTAPGYQPFSEHRDLTGKDPEPTLIAWLKPLPPPHVDPSGIPLGEIAAARGAMWPLGATACGPVPLGPRPLQPDNVIATVFITDYSADQQTCIINELKARGYTHVVMGPLVDSDGYHGIWQPNDWRGANFSKFLYAVQMFYDAGLKVVVFGKPDNWTLDQFKAEFTTLLATDRSRRLIKFFVPMGWEAGAGYEYSSCTWAAAGQWAHTVLPDAVLAIHMVADRDAPAGTDALCNDDDHTWNPGGNAAAWGRVVPFYHVWLSQNGAFADPSGVAPNGLTNFQNFQNQFNPSVRGSLADRFVNGYAGWPMRISAWGNVPILLVAGEYKAYWTFWEHRTEAEGVTWGDAAMAAGANGYLDSGSVPVPVIR